MMFGVGELVRFFVFFSSFDNEIKQLWRQNRQSFRVYKAIFAMCTYGRICTCIGRGEVVKWISFNVKVKKAVLMVRGGEGHRSSAVSVVGRGGGRSGVFAA